MRQQAKTAGAAGAAAAVTRIEDRLRSAAVTERAAPEPGQAEVLFVDGKKIVITAADEIELRCGDAVIRLTRDGKVIIRGANISSRATAQNRIRGGSVHIN